MEYETNNKIWNFSGDALISGGLLVALGIIGQELLGKDLAVILGVSGAIVAGTGLAGLGFAAATNPPTGIR